MIGTEENTITNTADTAEVVDIPPPEPLKREPKPKKPRAAKAISVKLTPTAEYVDDPVEVEAPIAPPTNTAYN